MKYDLEALRRKVHVDAARAAVALISHDLDQIESAQTVAQLESAYNASVAHANALCCAMRYAGYAAGQATARAAFDVLLLPLLGQPCAGSKEDA